MHENTSEATKGLRHFVSNPRQGISFWELNERKLRPVKAVDPEAECAANW